MSFSIEKFLLLTIAVIEVTSVEQGTGNGGSGGDPFLSMQNVVISLSMLCIFILVAVGCTWVWWKRTLCFWRNQGTHEAPPDWFVPGGSNNFATLDPVNLQRDVGGRTSITIEPLPTLSDMNVDSRDSFELRTYRAPGIVPNEEEINSQDWFEEPQQSFPRKNLEYQKIIGKGWFGKVLEADAKHIKPYIRSSSVIVRSLRDNATEQEQSRFLDEARMFRDAQDSDHILKLLGHCVEEMPYILIFEYFPLGDLKTYLRGKAKLVPTSNSADDGVVIRMIIDIVRGVKWMQQAGFVHGDLAARNCLVALPAGKVVIGDYGCSTQKFRDDYYWTSGFAIPIRWAAPETVTFTAESLSTSNITHAANIWSLGVVIWEVFQFGKTPYSNLTDEDVIKRVLRNKSYILDPPQFPFVKETTKEKLYQLLVSCWNSVPNHRPSIDAIEEVFTTP